MKKSKITITGKNSDELAHFYERYLDILPREINDEDKIETEEDLRLATGRQKLKHKNQRLEAQLNELRTDNKLKIIVAGSVFGLLFLETLALFVVLLLQGFKYKNFYISDTTLNIFVPATILQISSMAIIITKYLFSNKNNK